MDNRKPTQVIMKMLFSNDFHKHRTRGQAIKKSNRLILQKKEKVAPS